MKRIETLQQEQETIEGMLAKALDQQKSLCKTISRLRQDLQHTKEKLRRMRKQQKDKKCVRLFKRYLQCWSTPALAKEEGVSPATMMTWLQRGWSIHDSVLYKACDGVFTYLRNHVEQGRTAEQTDDWVHEQKGYEYAHSCWHARTLIKGGEEGWRRNFFVQYMTERQKKAFKKGYLSYRKQKEKVS